MLSIATGCTNLHPNSTQEIKGTNNSTLSAIFVSFYTHTHTHPSYYILAILCCAVLPSGFVCVLQCNVRHSITEHVFILTWSFVFLFWRNIYAILAVFNKAIFCNWVARAAPHPMVCFVCFYVHWSFACMCLCEVVRSLGTRVTGRCELQWEWE